MAKIKITERFASVPNILLNNKEVSLKAKGMYAYIQSKPDDWDFSVEKISYSVMEGIESVRKTLQELEKFGYLERVKVHLGTGKFDTEYNLYATPRKTEATKSHPLESDPLESRSAAFLPLEKPQDIYKQDSSKKELVNNDDKKAPLPITSMSIQSDSRNANHAYQDENFIALCYQKGIKEKEKLFEIFKGFLLHRSGNGFAESNSRDFRQHFMNWIGKGGHKHIQTKIDTSSNEQSNIPKADKAAIEAKYGRRNTDVSTG